MIVPFHPMTEKCSQKYSISFTEADTMLHEMDQCIKFKNKPQKNQKQTVKKTTAAETVKEETTKAEAVKETAKKETAKKETAKKETEKKAPAKKAAAKKTVAGELEKTVKTATKTVKETVKKAASSAPKAAAKAVKETIYLQYLGKEIDKEDIMKKVKDIWTKQLGNKAGDMKTVTLYLKPEDNAVYYVVNSEVTGRVDI